ncbi:ATP-dependent Clp protease proteolytic subunit [Streptomyces sp. NPDC005438]|uniref:ATP-dependent Clp protease proteolytic subunit n=1 Tax=Streptomyces sp. NPDC005438 TaxID=3156880 RepID=UPI0033B43442
MRAPSGHHVLPEFTERRDGGTRTLDPYSKLLEERIVLLGTPLDDFTATTITAQLMHLEHADPDRDISLYVNSSGGSFTAMTAVYDTMRFVTCDVETVCLGEAGPLAAVLLGAGAPGKRLALPHCRVRLSQPSLAEPVEGQPADLAIQAAELQRTRATLERMLAEHSGHPEERVHEDIERDRVLDAEQAKAYGLVDRLVTRRPGGPGAR